METILIILGIYILGCILAFGRFKASIYQIEEKYIEYFPVWDNHRVIVFFSLFSFIGFLAGIVVYFIEDEKYFFKYSYKPLIDRYNKIHKDENSL